MYRGWNSNFFLFCEDITEEISQREGKLPQYDFFSKYDLLCKYIFKGLWIVGYINTGQLDSGAEQSFVSKAKFFLSYIFTK